jgi:hypothetical protein
MPIIPQQFNNTSEIKQQLLENASLDLKKSNTTSIDQKEPSSVSKSPTVKVKKTSNTTQE